MRTHLDVLGWLHAAAGAFAVLVGGSLFILVAGTHAAVAAGGSAKGQPTLWLLTFGGAVLVSVGAAMIVAGCAVSRRRPAGRVLALVLGAANLPVMPFGTALAIYTFWTLLNDEARREFGAARGPFLAA